MKNFSIIAVLIFSFFFFVSCGNNNDESDTPADTTDTSVDTGNTDADTDPVDTADTTDTGDTDTDTDADTDTDTDTDTGDTGTDADTDTDTGDTDTDTDADTDTDTGDTGDIDAGDCAVISLGAMKIDGSIDSYAYYSGTYQPGTGTATIDEIDFEIYSETTVGTYDLTEGYNTSYSSCAQCIVIYEDIVYDNEGYFEGAGKYYYPDRGTMTINSFSYDSGSLNVTLENVRLIQVTREYNSESDRFNSEPVENGSCIVIQNTTINI